MMENDKLLEGFIDWNEGSYSQGEKAFAKIVKQRGDFIGADVGAMAFYSGAQYAFLTTRAEVERLRRALERITKTGCGCGVMTPCHCNDNLDSLIAWKEGVRDWAQEALDGMGG